MNYCTKCSKIIHSIKYCKNCKKQFCSEACLRHHIYTFHFKEQYSKKANDIKLNQNINNYNNINNNNYNYNYYNNNNLELSYLFFSPYLSKGTLTIGKVIYDQTYSLKNFKPIIENGKHKVIGCGSYGKVFLAVNKIDKKLYAIKHMKKKDLCKALKTLKGIYTEIDIQSRINHPNIVKLLYVKENKDAFDLVMEYANKGNLFFYIKRNSYLTEKESFKYFIQIVNAIYFLHKNDLIHRDIKPENILMFNDGIVKLCDFGWCTKLEGGQRITFCGTVEYMSPEMVNKEKYNKEIDIWSLGILLYEMIHGHSPFRPNKPKFKILDVINNIKIQNLKFNRDISEECKELIIHLLDRDATKRYKIEDIFNSTFVKYYENKEIYLKSGNITINQNKNDNNINFKQKENPLNEENKIEKESGKVPKNNTARNFYPNPFEKKTEKNIIENNNNYKYCSHCKVKKTVEKFEKGKLISPRYISQDNLNNFFKKTNVKEKEQIKKNNVNSAVNLSSDNNELKHNEKKCQSSANKINKHKNIKKNTTNQPLTCRNKKYSSQTAKNRQISIEPKLNDCLINDIIQEANDINYFDNKMDYTNRGYNHVGKIRLNSCENYKQKKGEKKSKVYFNNNYIEENKSPLITEISENPIINNINYNITKKKPNSKVKAKILKMEDNNYDEIKVIINNHPNNPSGKRNTKVKNYYRNDNNKTTNYNINSKYNYISSSSPQINIINNNHIYNNNNIIKLISNNNNISNEQNKEDTNKNMIINNIISNNESSQNNEIDSNKQNYFPIKKFVNKDNNSSNNEMTIQDLDETPKKVIDNLKIMPQELLNNFTKELKGYLDKKEIN